MNSLIKYELLKMWKRPMVIVTLMAVIIIHIGYIKTNHLQEYTKEMTPYYQQYEGKMDTQWIDSVTDTYNQYVQNPDHRMTDEEFKEYGKLYGWSDTKIEKKSTDVEARLKEDVQYSNAYTALSDAYHKTHYKDTITNGIQWLMDNYANKYPTMDSKIIKNTYVPLVDIQDEFSFGLGTGYAIFQGSMIVMLRSFIILMIAVLATTFTSEYSLQTIETVWTTKKGRKKVRNSKVYASLISGIIGWSCIIITMLITIYLTLGFNGGNMYVQDFVFNFCPFALNRFEYLLCMLTISFFGAICTSLTMSVLASLLRKDNIAIILCILVMLVLPFLNTFAPPWLYTILFYHPANIVSADYLLNYIHITKIFDFYVPTLYIVGIVMLLYCAGSIMLLRYKRNDNLILESKIAAE